MKRRKAIACLLATAVVVGSLAGCGSENHDNGAGSGAASVDGVSGGGENSDSQEASNTGYQTTYGSKKFDDVTITVELFDRSNAPDGSTITDNRWTEYVNEQMNKVGINVEFVAVPRWDEVTKMQTMMTSQIAPDLTLTYTYSYAENYFKDGGTWDLSEFIDGEGQAENIKKYIGNDVLDIGRRQSGELYGITARRATVASSNLFIRKDWLDKLNLAIPTTPDELFEVLEQMVHKNPDGVNNVIGAALWGMDGNRCNLSMAFSQLAGNPKEMDIAYGIDYYYDPGFKEFLRYVNRLYNAGLMDKEYYTAKEDMRNSNIVTGVNGFFENTVNYSVDPLRGSLLKTLQENVPGSDIISIPNLENVNDGKVYSQVSGPGGLIAFCPKTADAETVEACMTYLDWMCTKEGGFTLFHGFEGEHFDYDEDGYPIVKDAAYNATDKDWIRTDIFLVGNYGYYTSQDEFNRATSKEAAGYEEHAIDNFENAMAGVTVANPSYVAPSMPDIQADLDLARNEYGVKLSTCTPEEFDALYEEFMAACEEAGIKTIVEERTAYFNQIYGE